MLARASFFLLLCCAAQRASALLAKESPSWPWGKSQQSQDEVGREEAVRTATIASYQEERSRTEAAVKKRKEEAEKPRSVLIHGPEIDQGEQNETAKGAMADAVQQELLGARRAQEQAQSFKEGLQAEQLKEFAKLKESKEAEKADEQAKAQAAEQAARDEQALQAKEAEVAQDQAAEASVQDRVTGFKAEMEAKQHELVKVLAWGNKLKAELAAKQRQLKEASEAAQAKAQANEQAKSDLQALKSAEAHSAEQVLAAEADVEREKQKIEEFKAEVLSKQHDIDEATNSEQAKAEHVQAAEAHAAAWARAAHEMETKQRELKAKWQAAEQARGEKVRAELEAKQKELKVLEKIAVDVPQKMKQKFEEEKQSKEREVKVVIEASEQVAVQATKGLSELAQPGCYVAIPSGCPKLPISKELWRKDKFANMQGVDATNMVRKEKCEQRKGVWDKYCDSKDAQMAFVANKTLSDK